MRPRDRVGAKQQLQSRCRRRRPDHPRHQRQPLRHELEVARIESRTCESVAVLEIVAHHQPALRIEQHTAARHQAEACLGRQRPVLDFVASRVHRELDARVRLRMHHRAQFPCASLAAERSQLLARIGRYLDAAAGSRAEDLDEVGSVGSAGADLLPQSLGRRLAVQERIQRGENAGPGDGASVDPVAQCSLQRTPHARDGGEARA
jgi:hypothetical protein